MVTLRTSDDNQKDIPYTFDKERDLVVYDSDKGEEIDIFTTLDKMAKIAQKTGKAVETSFNGVVFQITPLMQPDERVSAYLTAYKEVLKKSAKYQEALKKHQLELKEKELVDQLIKEEKLDITGFTYLHNMFLKAVPISPQARFFQDRWGRLMQVEQRLKGMSDLTLDFICQTATRATAGMSITQPQVDEAYGWLTVIWAQGDKLARITQEDPTSNTLYRKLGSDHAQEIYKTYQCPQTTDPIDRAQSAAGLLATVLQSEKLIDKFTTETKNGAVKWNELIPVLRLPQNDDQKQ